jgi:23S rRNA pseudouridine1911/1915/1917 synthase
MKSFRTIYDQGAAFRADKFLAQSLPALTRRDIQRAIERGNLSINGQTVRKPGTLLKNGDRAVFRYGQSASSAASVGSVSVKYENADLLVVEKPAGIPVYATSKIQTDSVVARLLPRFPELTTVGEKGRPGVVHRLDKDTSGLVILAKTETAYQYLRALFNSRQITKEYLSLVYGQAHKHGQIDRPLTKIGQRGQSKVRVDEQGKPALTEYWAQSYYRLGLDHYTLIRVKLFTGRTHQIRVHLASEHHPVMGDSLYGKPESQKLAELLKRQFLHAARLEFRLPDGTWLELQSALPQDLQSVLDKLESVSP